QPPSSGAFLQSEYNVALPCIRKLVAASSFAKPKVLTAASTLKFIPEELVVFCRDFRLLRFHFDEDGLAPQAFRVANAIAQAREMATWPGHSGCTDGSHVDGKPWDEDKEEEEEEEEEEGSAPTLLFESLHDWEKELKRQGAAGWRVSAINERFDMAPRCLEVLLRAGRGPCVLADTSELPGLADIQLAHLKLRALCLPGERGDGGRGDTPGHGEGPQDSSSSADPPLVLPSQARRPRRSGSLPWRGRGGWTTSGLGAQDGDTPATLHPVPPEPSDRDLNCLLASLVQLLADPHARTLPGFQSLVQREWVAAGHPFPRRLGLRRGSPREEAPVFLLFLDCTWQLVRQFPAAFGFTEAYLLALHDSSFLPYCSTFLFSCQRRQGRGGPQQPHSQTYTPVNGHWDPPQGSAACRLPPVWAWGLRYSRQQRARFRNPAGVPGTVGAHD
ncbi:MTMRB protein, partial [Alectura lathami]|nr:MTMRB protein [Alectura lathami]